MISHFTYLIAYGWNQLTCTKIGQMVSYRSPVSIGTWEEHYLHITAPSKEKMVMEIILTSLGKWSKQFARNTKERLSPSKSAQRFKRLDDHWQTGDKNISTIYFKDREWKRKSYKLVLCSAVQANQFQFPLPFPIQCRCVCIPMASVVNGCHNRQLL